MRERIERNPKAWNDPIISGMTAVDGGSTAEYVYNALNQRVEVTTASGSYEFLYDAEGHRISQWLNSNSGYGARIYWAGTVLASRATNGDTYFESKDWMETERMRTDASANTVATYTSLPFGDGYSVNSSDPNAQQDAPTYAMLDFDNESGTDHAIFRQYADTPGRWMSPDPYYGSYDANNPQSMNRYSYVMSNPLAYIDPEGLAASQPVPCGGGEFCMKVDTYGHGDDGLADLGYDPTASPGYLWVPLHMAHPCWGCVDRSSAPMSTWANSSCR